MSRINIQGTIENIRSKSNVYTPIIEAIVNSIQSIIDKEIDNGKIEIILHRDKILEFENAQPVIKSVEIRDNGLGFTQQNRDSFDTFYSELRKSIGGKGFGRFMFVKYFNNVRVESVFKDNSENYKLRKFRFGKQYEIIVDETIEDSKANNSYSRVFLENLKEEHSLEKQIETIAKKILERILIFFINDSFKCPTIIVKEADESQTIILNDYLTGKNEIQLFKSKDFEIKNNGHSAIFTAKIFKIFFPGSQKSKISLTGHNREVTESPLHKYVPEFEDDFFDESNGSRKNYIIKTYVLGDYLDSNVSTERENFDFQKDGSSMHFPYSQIEIETNAAQITKDAFGADVQIRTEKKSQKIRNYINHSAPWHKVYLPDLDLSRIAYNLKDEDIEIELQKVKFNKELQTRAEIRELLNSENEDLEGNMAKAISKISEIGKSDLAHYVFNRKNVLEAFIKLLKRRDDGKGELEKDIHNLIFPMGRNSENTEYQEHNLWLLDERLVFSEFIASDTKISTKKDALGEPDLVVFDQKQSFRNGDNNFSNPLTIFEFKRPKRENYKEEDDPILQIGKYLKQIRLGKYEMPEGLEKIKVNDNTPVYGYVVCDLTNKIVEFAEKHQLTLSPDQEGYFGYHNGYKMYIEIISFKKLLGDATLRNKIFFKKLQLE
ncbi:ATP-binding protein [uncultured Draconibacterium sp.]|uniref:ATP-binding protein n=1 Tax=uncultured Draconibacterium sp. TaxID=1573823 RepID=UPI00321627E6